MNALDEAIRIAGSAAELARLVGVVPMAVTQWRKRGQVPAERCLSVEDAVGGAVTRYQLRPDVFGTEPSEEKGKAPRSLRGTGTNRRSPSDRRDVIKAA